MGKPPFPRATRGSMAKKFDHLSSGTDGDRRGKQSEHLVRVLEILRMLHGRRIWNLDELARRFGCTPKTLA
jgi:AraC-like DNA-binding protein